MLINLLPFFGLHFHQPHPVAALHRDLVYRILLLGPGTPAHGQGDGGNDGDQQDHRGNLERGRHHVERALKLDATHDEARRYATLLSPPTGG